MATQVDDVRRASGDGIRLYKIQLKLITSGTTVSYTLPVGTPVYSMFHHNVTTDAVGVGTYVGSTGVYTSPTMAVNDVCRIGIITD